MEGTAALVSAALAGDQRAWDVLVDRYTGLLWAVARAHRLSTPDAADVVQTTWLRCVEHLDRVRDAERLGPWLATTARRECLRSLQRAGRQVPSDDDRLFDPPDTAQQAPDASLLRRERAGVLWGAVDALPDRCRRLLRVLMADPPPPYEAVSAALGMPVGSIGPTRSRCLDRLRRVAEVQAAAELGVER